VVLHEPEIPNNTGNIGRTCVALGCSLHLVKPLGFDTSEHALRRAGLDYWPRLAPTEHEGWPEAVRALGDARMWLFTTKATRPAWEADLRPGDALVFGKETAGLPAELLGRHADRLVTIPMVPGERSLNLATAVCAVVCEGVRQCVARGERRIGEDGRLLAE
jgi:tRNA (cytidine/uridine-2'-O-)-methyltransferase